MIDNRPKYRFEPKNFDVEASKDNKVAKLWGFKEQLEWIKRQLEYATFSEKYSLRYNLKKGEIYEFDWGINVNAEFSNRHYGVVLADSNEYNPLVLVCPLKTNKVGAHPKSDLDLGIIDGLPTNVPSIAVVNQIRALDKLRLYTRSAIGETKSIKDHEVPVLDEKKVNLIVYGFMAYLNGNDGIENS